MLFEFKNYLEKIIKRVPSQVWILAAIVLVGIFLRSYDFHGWLDFGSDQVNDATRVGAVVEGKDAWPSYGPDMGNSGKGGRSNRFRLGPLYYDFEIISAKLFGDNPVSMAYPDLLFSILSIPLFYLFLRRIFETNLSLVLTGLYSISFFSLSFSHSAWNVNSIPFFSLLFLLSLYEFIVAKEETYWGWIIALGITLGVSVQLHAILLVLFPATLFFACLLFMRKNPKIWKKLGAVIVIMIILNLGQISAEQKNGFKNTKIFLDSVGGSSTSSSDSLAVRTAYDLSCNFQSNTFMLSALGSSDCNFSFVDVVAHNFNQKVLKKISTPSLILQAISWVAFSALGYGLLIRSFRTDEDKNKRYFYGLLLLYTTLSFFVMLPVIDAALRYFVHIFFLPFIFLGLVLLFLKRKFPQKYLLAAVLSFAILALSNSWATYLEVKDGFVQSRIILGDVETMVDYMVSNSGSQKEIYLLSSAKTGDFFKSLSFVAAEKNVSIIRAGDNENIPREKAKFYLGEGTDETAMNLGNGATFDHYKIINQVALFHLTN